MQLCLECETRFAALNWRCPACGSAPRSNGTVLFAPELANADVGFEQSSFDHLPELEENSFWFEARNSLLVWAIRDYFPDARSLLEIGCGTGFVLAGLRVAFPDMRLVGSELSVRGLEIARQRLPDAELLQMDARRIPFDSEFDLVGAFDVIEHVDEDVLVLQQMAQAVKPGGGILITVPQHPRLWSPADEFSRHRRRYVRGELTSKLASAGIRLLRTTSFVSLLLPAIVASRVLERRRSRFDPVAEFRASGGRMGAALGAAMTAERILIRAGVSFAAGGSLLAVGRRET
jgi:SAM-dependent methyltransferase